MYNMYFKYVQYVFYTNKLSLRHCSSPFVTVLNSSLETSLMLFTVVMYYFKKLSYFNTFIS